MSKAEVLDYRSLKKELGEIFNCDAVLYVGGSGSILSTKKSFQAQDLLDLVLDERDSRMEAAIDRRSVLVAFIDVFEADINDRVRALEVFRRYAAGE
ncbi:MAG: hypothetical protein RRY12_01695 [Cloacibacillus sp.]